MKRLKPSRPGKRGISYAKWGYLFIAPFFITYAIFNLYPLFLTFYNSFFENYRSGLKQVGPNFVGLSNYIKLFTPDSEGTIDILKYAGNTVALWLGGAIPQIVIALLLAFGVGMFIFFVYKKTYSGVMYSSSFGGTLVALTMITSMVILAVTSNVVLSLGMVGALSIVRFRTAIKEPLDIAFLFWAIAAGIVLSAGMIPLAVFGSVVIGLVMLLFMNRKSKDNPFIAVISCRDYEAEKRAAEYLNKHVKKADIKSKTAQEGNIELNYEIRLLSDDTDFITELSQLEGVNSAVLVSYNGDYMG